MSERRSTRPMPNSVIAVPVVSTVMAAAEDERAHWQRDAEVELRGRDEKTTTWVRRED